MRNATSRKQRLDLRQLADDVATLGTAMGDEALGLLRQLEAELRRAERLRGAARHAAAEAIKARLAGLAEAVRAETQARAGRPGAPRTRVVDPRD